MEASWARPGEEAVMTSARYTQSSAQCSLSLFTYMNGVHMGSLLVRNHLDNNNIEHPFLNEKYLKNVK